MTIASELLDLEDEDGLIDPTTVVDWARDNPASALHGAIEWDDAIAAHAHRLWQVRRLVAIHIVTDDGQRQRISLLRDRKSGGGYRDVSSVMRNDELRAEALAEALAELERWQARYQHLRELADVFESTARVRAHVPRRARARESVQPAA